MLGTYVSLVAILVLASLLGQGLLWLCGRREWSSLAPAFGLAILFAVAWGGVNLGGDPLVAVVVVGLLGLGAAVVVPRERPDGSTAIVVVAAVALCSLPFAIEGRFGILGTSLNPDMSQHLFAADRLASGGTERLISEGYPLGPHALVVALADLGPDLVQAFGGLTLAIAVATCLAPLTLLRRLSLPRLVAGGLIVGLTYMAASGLIQGSFKETAQALFVLAFAVALLELTTGASAGTNSLPRWERLQLIPLAALAVGSIYAYSFPGLAWLVGTLAIFGLVAVAVTRGRIDWSHLAAPVAIGVGVLAAAVAPEVGRIIDFGSFETFNPDGDGLGNLFNSISPIEALGIWPSGDFRLDAGAGFAPEIAFGLGGLVALVAFGFGLIWWLRRGEVAVPAAIAAAIALYLYAAVSGTPYQEAKAILIAAPLLALLVARALLTDAEPQNPRIALLAAAYLVPAAACSVLALANGPVGPASWGPGLIELRQERLLTGPVQALGSPEFLTDEHGADLLGWELRGGEVCVDKLGAGLPPGATQVVTVVGDGDGDAKPPYPGLEAARRSGDYALWNVIEPERVSQSVCPFVADGARAAADPTE